LVHGCGGDGTAEEVDPVASDDDDSADDDSADDDLPARSPDEPSASDDDSDEDFSEIIAGARAGEVSRVRERISIDQTAAYAGFDIDVEEVLIGQDPVGFELAQLNLVLTNRTSRINRLQTDVALMWGDTVAMVDRDATPQPDPGASEAGYFSFRLERSFTSDDAVLFIGRVDRNRVQIPFGSAGDLVTLAPEPIATTAEGSDATSTIALTRVELRWDSANPQEQSEPGKAFLHIEYALETAVATALSDDVLSLLLPSGEDVSPLGATTQAVDAGDTVEDLYGVFPVDDPASGDYVLTYSERFGNGAVEVPFSVP
jgi:hypothetical protein